MSTFSFPPDGGVPLDSSQPDDGANDFNSTMLLMEEEGIGFLHEGRLDAAEEKFREIEEFAITAGDESWTASARSGLGVVFAARGDFAAAEKMHRDAIAIDERLGNVEGLARDYSNLASALAEWGELDKAEVMFKTSLEFCRQAGLMNVLAGVCGNLGIIYKTRGDLDSAEKMYLDALALHEEFGRKEGIAYQCGSLGALYLDRKDFVSARAMLVRALALDRELGLTRNLASDHYNFGVLHRALGENEKAVEMFETALEFYRKTGDKEMIAAALAALEKLGKTQIKETNGSEKDESAKRSPEAAVSKKSAFARPEPPPVVNTNKFPFEIEAERRRLEEAGRPKFFDPDKFGFWLEKFFDSLPAPHKTRPERPDTITVDFNTSFETFLGASSLGCLAVSLFFFWKGFFGNLSLRGFTSPPDPGLIVYAVLAAMLGAVAITARLYTDNYFFIDKAEKKIYYQFRCFSFSYVKLFLEGSAVEAFGVSGRPARDAGKYDGRKSPGPEGEDGWEYCVFIIDKNGRTIKFGDFSGGGGPFGHNSQAAGLAEVVQCRAFENPGRSSLFVDAASGAPLVRFESESAPLKSLFTANDVVVFFVFLVALSILIYAAFGR